MIKDVQHIAILGAAESGIGAALLAITKGYTPFVSDKGTISEANKTILNDHHIEWEEEQHSEDRILSCDLAVKSPGIPDSATLVVALREKGIKVISEIEFGYPPHQRHNCGHYRQQWQNHYHPTHLPHSKKGRTGRCRCRKRGFQFCPTDCRSRSGLLCLGGQ